MSTRYLTTDFYQSEGINEIVPALVKFQMAFEKASLTKDKKNDHLRNQYVSLDNLLHVIRPLLTECGLVIIQQLAGEYLTTVVYHVSGQYIGSNMPFNPMNGNKGTNALQELGGGITYAKRYSISALLQISVDVDNDADKSPIQKEQLIKSKKKVETTDQLNKLVDWICEDLSRRDKITQLYDLNSGQLQWIDGELQNRF